MHPEVFACVCHLHSCVIDVEREGCISLPSEVHDHLPGLIDVEDEIVLLAPLPQLMVVSMAWDSEMLNMSHISHMGV